MCDRKNRYRRSEKGRAENRERMRRRRAAETGAARRRRAAIDQDGWARCARCGIDYPAFLIEVDHIVPMVDGGKDTESNIQDLCYACHQEKTTEEARCRRSS